MANVKIVEGEKRYTGGVAIEVTANKVINLILRSENNLLQVNDDNELYCDLQLEDGIRPNADFPVGITVGRVLQEDGWYKTGTALVYKTTSGDYNIWLYGNDNHMYFLDGENTWHQIYYSDEVDALIQNLQDQINALDVRLTTAEDDIDALEGRMDTAESDIDSLETRMTTAETNIATNTTDIATNRTNIATNTTNIATNANNIQQNTDDIDNLETRMDIAETNITANRNNITTNTNDIRNLNTRVATNTTNIATNTANITALGTNLANNYYNKDDVDTLLDTKADITDMESADDTLQAHIDQLAAQTLANLATKSNVGHTHVIADVTGLQTALDSKVNLATEYETTAINVDANTGELVESSTTETLENGLPITAHAIDRLFLYKANKAYVDSTFAQITNTYTKEQVDNLISGVSSVIKFIVVNELPEVGDGGYIYLVPKSSTQEKNIYDEYVWITTGFEKIGDTKVDLSNYVTLDGNQTISGKKTFTVEFSLPNKTTSATNSGTKPATEAQVYLVQSNLNSLSTTVSNLVTGVSSVNSKTGAVTLTSDDVTQGNTNLYVSQAEKDNWNAKQGGTSTITQAEITAGTATVGRLISGATAQAIVSKAQTTVGTPTNNDDAVPLDYLNTTLESYTPLSAHNTLATQVNTNSTNIGTNTDNITALTTRVGALETSTGNIGDDYVTRTTAQTISGKKTFSVEPVLPTKSSAATNSGTKPATEAQVYKVANDLTTLGNTVSGHTTSISNLQTAVSTNTTNIETNAQNITNIQTSLATTATASKLGVVKLGSDTVQTVAANNVTAEGSRTYAVQKNGSDQLVVNVPWTDTLQVIDEILKQDSNNPVRNSAVTTAINGKQATISDLSTIRTNATNGATVVSGVSGTTYTIKTSTSEPSSGTDSNTITFVLES